MLTDLIWGYSNFKLTPKLKNKQCFLSISRPSCFQRMKSRKYLFFCWSVILIISIVFKFYSKIWNIKHTKNLLPKDILSRRLQKFRQVSYNIWHSSSHSSNRVKSLNNLITLVQINIFENENIKVVHLKVLVKFLKKIKSSISFYVNVSERWYSRY